MMMAEVVIKLPESVAAVFGPTAAARAQRLTENAAVEEYRAGSLSHRQVGEMLNLDYWQTEQLLASRGVSLNYDIAELEADRATLQDMLG
jgi:predicted HTH domain antitoxin